MFSFFGKIKLRTKKSELEKYRVYYHKMPVRIFGMTRSQFRKYIRG